LVRSVREIAFRARQEAINLKFYWFPPRRPETCVAGHPVTAFPDGEAVAARLRGSDFARAVREVADDALRHRFHLLGYEVDTGPKIQWRRDYINGHETGSLYFRRIPYLDFAVAGDHKVVWELNRHQHLITLAQSWLLSGHREAVEEIEAELEGWWDQNPMCRGINWASALEVAFRTLSWIWVLHLAEKGLRPAFVNRLHQSLYQHGRFLAANLSHYFSPNTHLLGEAVALHALGRLFPEFPEAGAWRRDGRETTLAQMRTQTLDDGAHFEKSAYYHVYALDLFLLHAILETPPVWYRERLERMAEYLHALQGPDGELPLLGDDDGGRVFHPYRKRTHFGRGSLAACASYCGRREWLRSTDDLHEMSAWWLPQRDLGGAGEGVSSRYFDDSELAVMVCGDAQVIVDVRGFGAAGAGHSHAHALQLLCRKNNREILVDPGTYTYVADAAWRRAFRGTAAHNTLCVDGLDQAEAAGPFRWKAKPATQTTAWSSSSDRDFIDAKCCYRGLTHRRRILFVKPDLVIVIDNVDGPAGERLIERFWHVPDDQALRCISVSGDGATQEEEGWRSNVFGRKEPCRVLRTEWRGNLPFGSCSVIDLSARRHEVILLPTSEIALVRIDGRDYEAKP
jgi:hypothetical protein